MYEIDQVIISVALIALGLWFILKKKSTKASKIVGIIIILLVILGAISPLVSNSQSSVTTTNTPETDNISSSEIDQNKEEQYKQDIVSSILAGDNELTEADAECIAEVTVKVHGVDGIDRLIANDESPFSAEVNSQIELQCGITSTE